MCLSDVWTYMNTIICNDRNWADLRTILSEGKNEGKNAIFLYVWKIVGIGPIDEPLLDEWYQNWILIDIFSTCIMF